jgi:hypothetical protein
METENYEWKTTFREDFAIADVFGKRAVEDTYKNSLEFALSGPEYFGEFVCVLNWGIWNNYEKDELLARVYDKLWREADEMIYTKFPKKEDRAKILEFLD